jgi:phenylalanyl-tRNA synthetase beta chain
MKFTLSWLKDHLETSAPLDDIVEALTRVGLEVEGVENPAEKLAPFTIAKVLTAERHPQADKLQVLSVDTGSGEPVQVVCGAPNARAGMLGVFGAPGAYVPGSDITLKVAAIRGVESRGMMCSIRELELGEEHDGIIALPEDAPVGARYADWAGLDHPVIDVAVTPNRPDCMGVRGIARDLAAAGLGRLIELSALSHPQSYRPPSPWMDGKLVPPSNARDLPPHEVRIEDREGCLAFYSQRLRGVSNGASPDWMQRRLKAIGQKPISPLVDITNYIMFDLGRPLHVYDRAKLSGPLVARKAREGETVLALNGKTYALDPSITVIADDAAVHDIAGIMGGEDSSVTGSTTDVVVECALFSPDHIARTGQKLGLTSDARQRFERGVDPQMVYDGLYIATRLMRDICGGELSAIVQDEVPPSEDLRIIDYDPGLAARLGGLEIAPARQRAILEDLGFSLRQADGAWMDADEDPGDRWRVAPPSWRPDVQGAADLVEEVIRIEGIDKVPSTPLERAPGVARPTASPEQLVERRVRRTAASRGLNEAVTWSFVSEDEAAAFGGSAWVLENPISEEMKAMRPSLLAGLAAAARRNIARGAESVRLFEVGRRYLADGERPTVGLLLAGDRAVRHWRSGKGQSFDPYDAKAEALALLAAAGAPVANLQTLDGAPGVYHPGRSGRLCLGPKTVLAEFGELHPATLKAFDLSGPAVAAEIFLDAIPQKRASGHMRDAFSPPALQAVKRDFAFLVPEETQADSLIRAVRGADKATIAAVELFDLFTGAGVPERHKSLALEVTLQPQEKSFAEEDLKAISARIVAAAAKIGARLRD